MSSPWNPNTTTKNTTPEDQIKNTVKKATRVAVTAVGAVLTLGVAFGSWFSIDATEVGFVRRFGVVQNPNTPLEPGVHFKVPFIETLDTMHITINTKSLKGIIVQTNDNQPIMVSTSMTYRIPKSGVYHLMYDVGKAGNFDVDTNVDPIIRDRIMKIFAQKNTVKISEERGQISNEIQAAVTKSLNELFRLEVLDFQVSEIKYSDQFTKSVEQAVQAKNDAITAENRVRAAQFDGERQVVNAKAARDSAIAQAQGEAEAIKLKAKAEADAIALKATALEKNSSVVALTMAEKWNGSIPVTINTGAGGAIMDLRGILPALTGKGQ